MLSLWVMLIAVNWCAYVGNSDRLLEPTPNGLWVGACTLDNQCLSGHCKGGHCCTASGTRKNCMSCSRGTGSCSRFGCSAGYYWNEGGCHACPLRTHNNRPGADSIKACVSCSSNHHAWSGTVCQPCPALSTPAESVVIGNESPQRKHELMQPDHELCTCPVTKCCLRSNSTAQATCSAHSQCPANMFLVTNTLTIREVQRYVNLSSTPHCFSCPGNSTSEQGSTSIHACKCASGLNMVMIPMGIGLQSANNSLLSRRCIEVKETAPAHRGYQMVAAAAINEQSIFCTFFAAVAYAIHLCYY